MVRFTSLFAYWCDFFHAPLYQRFRNNLCDTTSFCKTHTRLDYGFCQDSGPGDLSVLSFVLTFSTMSPVISSGSCSFSPRFSTGNIGSNLWCKD